MKKLILAALMLCCRPASAEITGLFTEPAGVSTGAVQLNIRGFFGSDGSFSYSTTTKRIILGSGGIQFPDGSFQSTAASGTGGSSLPLPEGATNYIQNTNSLQSGSTFYVSSGTVKGKLTISMPADAVYGINLDNFSVQNTTTSTTGVRYWGVWGDLADDSLGGAITGLYSIIDNRNPVTGTIPDANLSTIGLLVDVDSNHNDTVDHQDGAQLYYGGLYQIAHSGTHTGIKQSHLIYGDYKSLLIGDAFNNAGGTYTRSSYGSYTLVQDNPTLTAGTLTRSIYGNYITVSGNTQGTSTGYGLYIERVANSDTNYAIYDNSASKIYSNSPTGINDTNYQAMFTVTSNSAALPVLRVKGAATHSSSYITVTDNAGSANYFNIGSSDFVVNDTQLDRDTRIESDNDDDTLFVDAGRDSVGFRIQTPTSTVDINGSFGATVTATTANLLLNERHHTIFANASGGAITLWLPSASVAPRRIYNIKKTDATTNAITIDPNGSQLIENNLTLALDEEFEAYTIQSDGTGWWVLNKASASAGVTVYPASSTILGYNGAIVTSTFSVFAPDSVSSVTIGITDLPSGGGFGSQKAYPYILGVGNEGDPADYAAFRIIGSTQAGFISGRGGDVEISMLGGPSRNVGMTVNTFGTSPTRNFILDESRLSIQAPAIANEYFTAMGTSSFKSSTTFTTAIDVSSSSFMDSRFNVYTSSNIPYPYYNMQTDFMKPTFSAINGQLDTYRTIKEFTLSVTGAVGNSGATYIRDLDMVAMADNNALAIWIYRAGDFSVRYASITLSGFQDTEAATWMYNIKDSTGNVAEVWLAVSEEQTNQIKIFKWIPTTAPTVIFSSNTLILNPTNMPATSATVGQEAICFDRKRRGFHTFKQDTPFDYRFVPWNGSLTPAGVELWDAETLYSALMPSMNDCDVDEVNDRIIIIGDATSAATVDQDILAVNPDTGARLDYWNNFPSGLNLNVATWGQSEGICMYGNKMWVTSEGTNAMLLEADNGSHGMANGHVSVGSTTLDTGAWFSATASSAAPVAIFRSLVTQTTVYMGVQDSNQRYLVDVSSGGYFQLSVGTATNRVGNVGSVFAVQYASTSNLANTQTELFCSTITGGSFPTTGDGIKFRAFGSISPIGSVPELRISFGVSTSSNILTLATFTNQTNWEISGWIRRVGTSTARAYVRGVRGTTVIDPTFTEVTTNMLGNNLFRILGQAGNAGDVTLLDAVVETDPGTSP